MFSSKPAPFSSPSNSDCASVDTRAWCNKRGYGNTLFEHSLNDHATTQPSHRLETIHHSEQPCMYLNKQALVPQHSHQVQPILNASCENDGNVPNWCVPATDNLTVQKQMFESVPYDK